MVRLCTRSTSWAVIGLRAPFDCWWTSSHSFFPMCLQGLQFSPTTSERRTSFWNWEWGLKKTLLKCSFRDTMIMDWWFYRKSLYFLCEYVCVVCVRSTEQLKLSIKQHFCCAFLFLHERVCATYNSPVFQARSKTTIRDLVQIASCDEDEGFQHFCSSRSMFEKLVLISGVWSRSIDSHTIWDEALILALCQLLSVLSWIQADLSMGCVGSETEEWVQLMCAARYHICLLPLCPMDVHLCEPKIPWCNWYQGNVCGCLILFKLVLTVKGSRWPHQNQMGETITKCSCDMMCACKQTLREYFSIGFHSSWRGSGNLNED